MTELMLDIGGGRSQRRGQNLVRLLVAMAACRCCRRSPPCSRRRPSTRARWTFSHIRVPPMPAQEQQLADALKRKLGRDIRITSAEDPA